MCDISWGETLRKERRTLLLQAPESCSFTCESALNSREALLLPDGDNEARCLFLCNCVSGTRLHLTETCVLRSHAGRFDNKVRSLQKPSEEPASSPVQNPDVCKPADAAVTSNPGSVGLRVFVFVFLKKTRALAHLIQ